MPKKFSTARSPADKLRPAAGKKPKTTVYAPGYNPTRGPKRIEPPVPKDPKGFHQHMHVARVAMGISRYRLSLLSGSDKVSIGRYEKGTSAPPVKVAARIAKVLGQSLDAMVDLAPAPVDTRLAALFSAIAQLPPAKQQVIRDMVKAMAI